MDWRVQTVIAFMKAHIQADLSLDEMAQSVKLSPSRISHLFKSEIGLSPMQYLKSLRMQRAKELIETTFLNVKQIMVRVGIRDKGHFTEDFKKAHGVMPAQYRKRQLLPNFPPEKSRSHVVAESANK